MKIKNYIQDLVDKGDIEVATSKPSNSNGKIKMCQDPFPKHGKHKASSSHEVHYDCTNYVSNFDSLVGCIEPIDTHINTITIQGVNPSPTSHRHKVTIQHAPPLQSSNRPSQENIVIQDASPSTSHS